MDFSLSCLLKILMRNSNNKLLRKEQKSKELMI